MSQLTGEDCHHLFRYPLITLHLIAGDGNLFLAFRKILASFKEGSEDSVEFYLTVRERFVHIEYFAVKDAEGSYLGTLELPQDATYLRELVGEKRLL